MTHDTAWFRRPSGDDPGTTNLCYNAVDRHVIHGRVDEVALTGPDPLRVGELLELVGAVAGAFRGLGVEAGSVVAVTHHSPRPRLVSLLAAARLGAVGVVADDDRVLAVHRPALWVTDRLPREWTYRPAAVVLDGPEADDPTRDVAWEVVLRAGRTDPAGCASVLASATAYVVDRPVTVGEALAGADDSEIGTEVFALVGARTLAI